MDIDVTRLEGFFLESAAKTYAGKGAKSTIAEFPGSKVYRVEEGDLLYVDMYHTNGEWSGGQTIIYQEAKAIWLMSYMGWCAGDDREVLDFLKLVLGGTYEAGVFYGGRGFPEIWQNGEWQSGLLYENRPELLLGSPYFKGREQISRWPGRINDAPVFWHEYQGMLLDGHPERGMVPPLAVRQKMRLAHQQFQAELESRAFGS